MGIFRKKRSVRPGGVLLPKLLFFSLCVQSIFVFLPGNFRYLLLVLTVANAVLFLLFLIRIKKVSLFPETNSPSHSVFEGLRQIETALERTFQANKELEFILDNIESENFVSLNQQSGSGLVSKAAGIYDTLGQKKLRREEDKKKWEIAAWLDKGQNRMADILRKNNDSSDMLSRSVIIEIIEYIVAGFGQIYMPDTKNPELLITMYTYGGTEKSFLIGEGSVGTVFKTQIPVHLNRGRDKTSEVGSLLGKAQLKEVYIFPVVYNCTCFAVIEIGTFGAIHPEHIDLLNKIGSDIAITFSNILANEKNMQLYHTTQAQMSQLQEKEFVLQQNLAELMAAQEQMCVQKLNTENTRILLKNIIDNLPFPVFVKNENSEYIIANIEQGRLFGIAPEKLYNKTDEFFIVDEKEIEEVRKSDRLVIQGHQKITLPEQKITFADGSSHILQTIKIPLHNNITGKTNILGISHDLSAIRTKDEKLQEARGIIENLKSHIKLLEPNFEN